MKKRKNNLDERQEQALLHIESQGFWLAWGGLLLAMLAQLALRRADLWGLLPEWAIFMAMNLYMLVQCLRHNICKGRLKSIFLFLVQKAPQLIKQGRSAQCQLPAQG